MARSRLRGIRGMTKLRRIMGRMPDEVGVEIKALVVEFSTAIEQTAKASALQGKMASRRYSRGITKGVARSGFSATIGLRTPGARRRAWFAHFIEYGTRAKFRRYRKKKRPIRKFSGKGKGGFDHPGTPARPVLEPSFEMHKPRFEPRMKRGVDRILERLSAGSDSED